MATMLTSTSSAYLTKDTLAELLDVREALIRQWVRDGTIPEHFYCRLGRNEYEFQPVAVAIGELMVELGQLFGTNSALPKTIARKLAPRIEMLWHEPATTVTLKVTHGPLTVTAPLDFVARAKEKLTARDE
jgi:hypothetical protein